MAERAAAPAANKPADRNDVSEATRTVVLLNEQAEVLRAELAALRQDLAQVERGFITAPNTILREANEQLVLAAMRAEAIANAATSHLDVLAGAELAKLMREGEAARIEYERQAHDLREANEHLVINSMNSQAMEATALEAHRRQIAFLATVVHELRNPLMPLRLAAQMLDRARNDERAHAKLQATITGQVAQMARLIGDLLEGSRISTGKFKLERVLIDIVGVLDRAIETCRPAMDARQQRFASVVPPGPVMGLGDSVRLVQVFGNLLENSAKYTPPGGEISLRAEVRGNALIVTISDNGIGISTKALPHVFDMFVRDAHATAANQGGLGIGLAVVRELVKAHEGLVVAASAGKDQGSEFVVTLPLAAGHRRPAGAE